MSEFSRSWTAEVLKSAPLIAPMRQFVWPMRIAGEEDALARGALQLMVRAREGGAYLVTCALGFKDPSMPTGVFGCPNEDEICAVAGGYAYVANTLTPENCVLVEMKPVVQVLRAGELLVFVGFQTLLAWGRSGAAWQTGRLSWEGLRVTSVSETEIRGFGWDLMADKEREFVVDVGTGAHTGGAFAKAGPPAGLSRGNRN